VSKWLRKLLTLMTALALLAAYLPAGALRAEAAMSPLTETEAVELLQHYDIVRGNPGGQLDLDQPLTRAQAATIFVRAMGFEELAQALKDVVPFTDAVGHWAAGEIAMAERLGLMRGDGNGTFRPQAEITYAEVLTVLLRIVKQEPTGAWNPSNIFATADSLGFAPRGVSATAIALRGKIFWSLASATSRVPLPTGETVLQKYHDQTPPTLSLDRATVEESTTSTLIAGTSRDAVAVLVNGAEANLDKTTGRFTFSASLTQLGANTFTVEALDWAGNKATASFTANRRAPIASIEITGDTVIKAGTSVKLTVTARDSRGSVVALEGVQATLTGDVATYDVRASTLTALDKTGRGVLTLTSGNVRKSFTFDVKAPSSQAAKLSFVSVNDGRGPTAGKDVTVKVQVLDQNGRLLTDDYFRSVRLSNSDLAGVTITPASATTQGGVATFTVRGSQEGTTMLKATSADLEEASTTVQFLTSNRIVLVASPTSLVPNGTSSSRIQAYLQDENGRAATNSSSEDIRIALSTSGTDGYFADSTLVIRRNSSNSSGDEGLFKSGILAGTATVTGTISSSHSYSVQSLNLTLTGTPTPVKLRVAPIANRLTPKGAPTELSVQVLDSNGRVVTWGSFAFRLRVSTSNGESVTGGLPDGVSLTYSDLNYGPISGARDNAYVVGRTHLGVATIRLAYDKSGTVTLTPELLGAVQEAYHHSIGLGPASGSTGLTTEATQFVFSGTPSAIQLTADSALGRDKPAGAVNTGTTMTIRARVTDSSGAPIPGYSGSITLTRSSTGTQVTRLSGTSTDRATRTISDGVAEFVVQANNTAGYDVYTATATGLPPTTITVAVRKEKPVTPIILALRGVNEDTGTSEIGLVKPDDDYMDVQLSVQDPPKAGEPTYWVLAKVTRKGSSTNIAGEAMVNLLASPPIIRIPKSSVAPGKNTYFVQINDGFGWSDLSPDAGLNEATNAVYHPNYRLGTTAYYDAATTKLVLSASGLSSSGTVNPSKFSIVKENSQLGLNSSEVEVVSVTSGAVTLALNGLANSFDPAVYNGTVKVVADDAWYASADGAYVAGRTEISSLKPAANVTHATLDKSTRILYLYGAGFTHGTLALDQIRLGDVALRPGTTSSTDRATNTIDGRVTIQLSQATFDALNALPGPSVPVTAAAGWLRVAAGGATYQAPSLEGASRTLRIAVSVTSIAPYDRGAHTITISGKGFEGSLVDPSKLSFRRTTSRTGTYRFVGATTATVDSDTTITITLSPQDAAFFESTTNGGFAGQQVYLNTDDGWLKDAQDRQADTLITDRHYFTVTAR
jgi:hypothetical protein